MPKWKNPKVVLEVPKALAQDINEIALTRLPIRSWNQEALEILYSYVAMHRARGNLD